MTDQERAELLQEEPNAARFVKPFIGAHEYLHNEKRWVIWLVNATPAEINALPKIKERVLAVDAFRKASKAASTRSYPYPSLFRQVTQPKNCYVLIPGHTSENRTYIPFGFFTADTIVGNSCFSLPEATLFHYGVIQSRMHMAWIRYTCGRIKSDYRYSKDIVYNNFVWPGLIGEDLPSSKRAAIETAAQAVLDARAQNTGTLADLYDPLLMPQNLLMAHSHLDKAVDAAYGYKGGKDDASRVAFLFTLFQTATSLLPTETPKKTRKKKALLRRK